MHSFGHRGLYPLPILLFRPYDMHDWTLLPPISCFGITQFGLSSIGLFSIPFAFLCRLHPWVQSSGESVRVATHPLEDCLLILAFGGAESLNTIIYLSLPTFTLTIVPHSRYRQSYYLFDVFRGLVRVRVLTTWLFCSMIPEWLRFNSFTTAHG
jgi:hypothetical protein